MPRAKNLVYLIAFDSPDSESYRFLGKMLISSLLRTFFTGDIVVFRNTEAPLFMVERKGLEEIYLELPPMCGQDGAERAWSWKCRAAELIDRPEQYDKILFLDTDSLALRNIDHLLEGDWDIRYQPERQRPADGPSFNSYLHEEELPAAATREGANSGTIAVRGSLFLEVMRRWREIDTREPVRQNGFRDQASWNALLQRHTTAGGHPGVNGMWHAESFPLGEVQFPGYLDPAYQSYSKAAITHNILPDTREKTEFTFGLYMRTFFCDPTGLFFSMLEM